MSITSRSLQIASVADNAPLIQIAGAQGGLLNLGVQLIEAVPTKLGLIVPATAGTATTSNTPGVENASTGGNTQAGTATIRSAWSSAPTFAGSPVYYRQAYLAAIGDSVEWAWPEQFPLAFGSSLGIALRNITGGASGICLVYARYAQGRIYLPALQLTDVGAG